MLKTMRLPRAARNTLLLAAGFLAARGLCGRVGPWGRDPVLMAKQAAYERERARITVLALGPSTTFHGFSPEAFDQEALASGLRAHSFNLGLPGAGYFELEYLLRRVLADPPPRLTDVVLDARAQSFVPQPASQLTARDAYWQDATETLHLLDYLRRAPPARRGALWPALRYAAAGWSYRALGLGRVGDALAAGLEPPPELLYAVDGRGFSPLLASTPRQRLRRRHFKRLAGVFFSSEGFAPRRGEGDPDPRYGYLAGLLARRGIRLTVVDPPGEGHARPPSCAPAACRWLDFSDASRYPQFLSDRLLFDGLHLTPEGAAKFSALLARELARP